MTRVGPDGEPMSIYDAAMIWQQQGVPLAVIAGKSMAPAPAVTGRRKGHVC